MAVSDISERLILVAGMHRSGTSALTRILNLIGCHIPEPVVPAFRGNEHGHWEPEAVVHMNDRFLADAGSHVNTSLPVDPEWFRSEAARRSADEIAQYLLPWLEMHDHVVVKDPRIALLAPVWRRAVEALGVTPRFVLPFRRPQEVAASLARRQLRFFPDEVWPLQRGVMIWLTHVVELERATRGTLRSFIGFDELLLSWRPGVERVLRQIEAPLPIPDAAVAGIENSIRGDARREFARDEDDVPPLVVRVLAGLHACASNPAASPAVFDVAGGELAGLRLLAGGYLRELETKVEGWGDLRTEALRAASERDEARGEVRRLQLRSNLAERAGATRAAEHGRLEALLAGALEAGVDQLGAAHALAAAQDEAERQTRRNEALMLAQSGRAAEAHRRRRRHAVQLREAAVERAKLKGDLAGARALAEDLRSECAQSKDLADREAAEHAKLEGDLAAERTLTEDLQSELADLKELTARDKQETVSAHAAALSEVSTRLAQASEQKEELAGRLARSDAESRAAAVDIQRLGAELERARTYAGSVAQEKLAASAEAESWRRAAEAQDEAARDQVQQAGADLQEERRARQAAETRADALAAEAVRLRQTLSWRVTAPMRRIRSRLR